MLRESYRIAKKYNVASVAISPFSEKRIIHLLEKKNIPSVSRTIHLRGENKGFPKHCFYLERYFPLPNVRCRSNQSLP